MKRYINIVAAIATIFAVITSCQREDIIVPGIDDTTEGYVTIEFAADVPDMNEVQTKAVDPDGGGVQNITVFCFDQNSLFITTVNATIVSRNEPAQGSTTSLGGQFKVTVPDHTVTMQLVGNQNLTYFHEDSFRGMSEVDVMHDLEASAGRMIYWARKTIDQLNAHNNASNPVKLIRNQAKFTLNVASGVNFSQKGWIVVNTNAFGTVAPYCPEHGFEAPHYTQRPFVTLPDNDAKLGDFLDVRTVPEEYVFETENSADSPVDFIVKGSQNGGPDLYYRISIVDDNGGYIPIYRNHHYTVNIVGDLYYGQTTFADALEAPATNNVLVSVSDDIRQITDGTNTLSVDQTFVVIGEEEFPQPATWYLHYNVSGAGASQAEVSWIDGNNVAKNQFTHTFDNVSGRGTVIISLNEMDGLTKREGTLLITSGRLTRKIKVVTVKKQEFTPAWITTNIYGGATGQNVTMMFHIPDDCPQELFPMDVLVTVNDLDVRNASGMVLPVITKEDERYGADNGLGYKYLLTVDKPGVQRVYLKTILGHDTGDHVTVKIEAKHFESLAKTATFKDDTDYRILLHDMRTYVGAMPADEVIYYYLVPQKINAPVEFSSHLGQVFKTNPGSGSYDAEIKDDLGSYYVKYVVPNIDYSTGNVDEFLLYSENLEHNHNLPSGTQYYFDFYQIAASNWSETAGRVMGFVSNGTLGTAPVYHLRTNKPKADEVVRIASNPKGYKSVTTGTMGEHAIKKYVSSNGLCNGEGLYKSAVFELTTYHPFHFAAQVKDAGQVAVGTVVNGKAEEVEETVEISYVPGHKVEISFDVTSFQSTIQGNDGSVLPADKQVSVDPFGTAFDIYIDAPMLEIDPSDPLYTSGKVTEDPNVEGRYIYHVAADRGSEKSGSLAPLGADGKATVDRTGERKSISFITKGIVSTGEITVSSDESKVVYYKKTFKVQNTSIRGTLKYKKDGNVTAVPSGSFVPFEMLPTYNRIGTIDIRNNGAFELRLRSEYRYDWSTDDVKLQYNENGVIYEKTFESLEDLYKATGSDIVLEVPTAGN